MDFSPRIDARLIDALPALDNSREPIAETRRRLGELAEALGLPRPSYESVRQLVSAHRRSEARRSKTNALIDLAFYTSPPEEILADLLSKHP